MKDFQRDDLAFSLCGLNCCLCPMRLGGYCPGCGGGAGNQSCAIARCSLQHGGVAHCFLCPKFPCSRYEACESRDSFITHQRQLRDIARAQEIGLSAYRAELEQKAATLRTLLDQYNDGRRKTFYCVVANLLPLIDLEQAMQQVIEDPTFGSLPIQEKAGRLAAAFEERAARHGLVLKLRQKPPSGDMKR
jgi:hypothetical protein